MANTTGDIFQQKLVAIAGLLGQSVNEFIDGNGYATLTKLASDKADLQAQIDAIIELDAGNGAVSLAEKIAGIEAVLSEDGTVQNIINLIDGINQAVITEKARAEGEESRIEALVVANKVVTDASAVTLGNLVQTVIGNKDASDASFIALGARVTATEDDVTTLKGDATVVGSVDNKIKAESDRAKAKELELQTALDALSGISTTGFTELEARVKANEDTLNDTTVDGNLVKGLKTRISETEALALANALAIVAGNEQTLADAKAYVDDVAMGAVQINAIDAQAVDNSFRASLGLPTK